MKQKSFKMFIGAMFLSFVFALPSFAQEGSTTDKDPRAKADKLTSEMAEILSLTEEQKSRIQHLNINYINEKQTAKTRTAAGNEQNTRSADAIRSSWENNVKSVLDENQKERFEEWNAKKKEKMDKKDGMKEQRMKEKSNARERQGTQPSTAPGR